MSERAHARVPRLVVSGTASGTGKTTVACALMQALVDRGFRVRACKTGPDYIDPMFHAKVIGAESHNLDLFFSGEDEVRAIVGRGAADRKKGQAPFLEKGPGPFSRAITVVEGAMGYYDGIAVSDEASAWHVARALDAPAVLVVDARGRARSIAAEVAGYARFRQPSQVRGVILNRCAPSIYPRLAGVIEEETGVSVYGYLPALGDCSLESRHLGLVTADEVEGLRAKLARLAAALEETVDVEGLVALAESAPELSWDEPQVEPVAGVAGGSGAAGGSGVAGGSARPRIAVARDAAFCFYYGDALAFLEALGAELVEFSPLRDAALPAGTCGLYLGGGYPELHARELSENAPMRRAVAAAVRAGVPTVAECGGFMYLHEGIEDPDGAVWPQVGVVPGRAYRTPRLRRFGYATLTAKGDSLLAEAGDELRAHEFHYWDSESCGEAFHAVKPQSIRSWECGFATPTLYAGYPHLFLASQPKAARRFVAACAERAARETAPGEGSGR